MKSTRHNRPFASLSPAEKRHQKTIEALFHLPPIEQVVTKKPEGRTRRVIKQIKDFLGR
jgi:hypothetical protein